MSKSGEFQMSVNTGGNGDTVAGLHYTDRMCDPIARTIGSEYT